VSKGKLSPNRHNVSSKGKGKAKRVAHQTQPHVLHVVNVSAMTNVEKSGLSVKFAAIGFITHVKGLTKVMQDVCLHA
jgi:hypothetical protein